MNLVADDMDHRKLDSSAWRSHDQRGSGLTEEEWFAVNSVAIQCDLDLDNNEKSIKFALSPSKVTTQSSLQESNTTIQQLRAARKAIVQAAIDDLREQLGMQDFEKLDKYISDSSTVVVIPATETGSRSGLSNDMKRNETAK